MKATGKVVVALLAIGVIVGLVTLFHGKRPIGSENLIGKQLPDFAVPLAGSGIDGDANIYTPQEATANKATAACNVRIKGSINSCDGLKGAAVLLFWNSSKTECVKQVDQLQAALAKHPKVNALAVASSDSMQTVTEWQKNKHWKLPIAVDPDGAASTLYSAPGCPSIFFAQDGKITGVKLGLQSSAQLSAEIAKNTNG